MSDLEHMNRRYFWRTNKASRRVHIENPETGRTHCQVENCGGRPLDGRGAEAPAGRRVCGNCTDLAGRDKASYQEPGVRVLMGERLVEAEPGLFASAVAPELWKRKRQARPAHRSKGRMPKRSNVKCARPFDDDLPW